MKITFGYFVARDRVDGKDEITEFWHIDDNGFYGDIREAMWFEFLVEAKEKIEANNLKEQGAFVVKIVPMRNHS